MRHKKQFQQIFIILFILSLIILIISPFYPFKYLALGIEKIISPLQRSVYLNLGIPIDKEKDEITQLRDENLSLKRKLVKMKTIESDNKAFRDQFAVQSIDNQKLIPVEIVGNDALTPGQTPTRLIIKLNNNQNIKVGQPVIYKDILIGVVTKISSNLASVSLTTNSEFSFPVKTQKTGALGLVKGDGIDMILDQVVTSEELAVNDLIVTKGNVNEQGLGFPPDLLVGKIMTIDKKPSALFQNARVMTLININDLSNVFVLLN